MHCQNGKLPACKKANFSLQYVHMTIIQALFLGLIQGFTEFLPISSSGHLIFVPVVFGWLDQGTAFDVVVHLGSLLAVVWYFRARLKQMFLACVDIKNPVLATDRKLAWYIILATLPALFAAFLFEQVLDISFRSTLLVAVNLIVWGVVLAIADRYATKKPEKKAFADHTKKTAIYIGLAQALALLPGTSRSGITMTAGLFNNFSRKAAAEFSFLMSIPVICIAGALALLQIALGRVEVLSASVLLAGFVSAAVSGYVAINLLMKLIQKWSFLPFAVYRVLVGILILIFLV